MDNQIVVFELETEFFGVKIAAVESIIKMQPITRLPHTPTFVEGITNLRGKILPVIDLRKRFSLPPRETDKNSRIIVVVMNDTEVGITVDGVSEVLTLPEQSVEPAPSIATTVDSNFIAGVAKVEQRLIILLDLEKVLSTEEQNTLVNITTSG